MYLLTNNISVIPDFPSYLMETLFKDSCFSCCKLKFPKFFFFSFHRQHNGKANVAVFADGSDGDGRNYWDGRSRSEN